MRSGVLSVLVLVPLLTLAPSPATAGTTGFIQPGVDVDGTCTLNFVYDGVGPLTGRVFVGVAAHCYSTMGTIVSTSDHANFGELAFIRNAADTATDFAFIEVYPAFHEFVHAEVKGHPGMPTAVATLSETERLDQIMFSGSGIVFENTQVTQEERIGALWTHTSDVWLAYGPVTPGDSGGPVLHESGHALGIVTQLTTSFACCGDPTLVVGAQGPTVEGIEEKAAAAGFPVVMRTL